MALSPQDLIIVTCKSLTGNWVRSGLTTFGVFMGVAAVNATLGVADISRAILGKQLAEREAPQVSISIWSSEGREPKLEDMEFLRRSLKNIKAISASDFFRFDSKVIYQNQEGEPQIQAVTQDYIQTSGRRILRGRFFNTADFDNYRPVAVIDNFLASKLFKAENPIGKIIFTSGKPFLVAGVIETKQNFGGEPKGYLVIPMSTYSSMTGSQNVTSFDIRPEKIEQMENLKQEAEALLKQRFPAADVYAWANIDDILMQQQIVDMASRGLNAVGVIALLISGVGITNITIASVIERTSEIGLRRAIGATKFEILMQFILEATILSLVGGIAAIGTVHGLTLGVTTIFPLPYQFEVRTATLSLASALLVGVGACFIPAIRASELDPVKALRE
ncbi:MAG: ABC transporter permease [Scytonematopsis contorta HA4267-MV1]|jgi:putative ABC transport system permease protein|nr:ABC transporter permease [Scytonematopsis contorta HA4267-MV1]